MRYVDEVMEEYFPGWGAAIDVRTHIRHKHHWLNPTYLGPKVPRRSPWIERLWYVGEGTAPVGGLGFERAAFAGHGGALDIVESLGLDTTLDPTRIVGTFEDATASYRGHLLNPPTRKGPEPRLAAPAREPLPPRQPFGACQFDRGARPMSRLLSS